MEAQKEISTEEEVELTDALLRSDDLLDMDIKVEWIVEDLIPKQGITLFFGRGGVGKTWGALQISKAVSEESHIWGRKTQFASVIYVDMENPLPNLKERIDRIGSSPNFWIWHLSNQTLPPPLLDDAENWERYKLLPQNSLLIFDTLRAAHRGDENSSKDMALIMGRLKELREMGFTIVLLHHTGKASESTYKGSTAISDLCDHALCLEQVKEETIDLKGKYFELGTKDKTRYLPSKIHLTFEGYGFIEAEDPILTMGKELKTLIREMDEAKRYQGGIVETALQEFDWNKSKTRKVLITGEGKHWYRSKREGKDGRVFYVPVSGSDEAF